MTNRVSHLLKLVSSTAVAGLFGTIVLVSPAQAGEQEVTGRYVNNKPQASFVKVGDVKGHVVGSFELTGISIYPDEGEVPRYISGNFDYTNGVGPHWGYTTVVYKDKSTLTVQWQGVKKRNEKNELYSDGTHTCVAGSGRFKGAKCAGTWRSTKYLSNGMILGEFKTKMTLPD